MNFVFGANIPLQGGQYGNAVLSRFPITASTNHFLPCLEDGEQRGVIEVQLEIAATKETVTLYATHLDHRRADQERIESAMFINKLSKKLGQKPALLAGDLNAVPTSEVLQQFKSVWTSANKEPIATIPVKSPSRQIDYVLFRPPARWRITETMSIDEPVASDHLPILTELELQQRSNVEPLLRMRSAVSPDS